MPPIRCSQTQNTEKNVPVNWMFTYEGEIHAVEVIDIPYSLFVKSDSGRKLLADQLREKFYFQADVDTMEFWMPTSPLPIKNARERIKETWNGFRGLAKTIDPVLPLSTVLEVKEENADNVHIILTAERLIYLNWRFFSTELSLIEPGYTKLSRSLFNSQLKECRKFFSEDLEKRLGFRACPNTIYFWKLKEPLSIREMTNRKDQLLKNGLHTFADEIDPGLFLSTALEGKERVHDVVHLFVSAEPFIKKYWCFFSTELSVLELGATWIPRHLLSGPSKECRRLIYHNLRSKSGVDHDTLRFWKPEEPFSTTEIRERKDQLLKKGLQAIANEIGPARPLSTVLEGNEGVTNIVHFFVCAEPDNRLPESKRYREALEAEGKSLSVAALVKNYRENQRNDETKIYDGRYPPDYENSTIAPPVELYHRIFNKFLYLIENGSRPTTDDLKRTYDLMRYLGELSAYWHERCRNEEIHEHLSKFLGRDMEASMDRTTPDGVISISVGNASVPVLIAEFTKVLGDDHYDPCVQASLNMQRRWKMRDVRNVCDKCCCPTFLIAGGGPWLGILGAVFTDKVIVQPLVELRWFGISSTTDDAQIWKNAKVLLALRQALNELERFYLDDLASMPVHVDGPHPRLYPYPTSYGINEERVEFKYLKAMDDFERCVTFLAEVVDEGGKAAVKVGEKIVVKYVTNYGKEVHEFLARQNFAPKLLYYGRLPDSPIFTSQEVDLNKFGLRLQKDRMDMVVMEYIEAKPYSGLPDRCREQIRKILIKLHLEGYVLGDLRDQNVLIDSSGSVKLIDFDWSGEYDTGKKSILDKVPEAVQRELKGRLKPRVGPYVHYPISISMGLQIDCADGVGPLKPIL